MNYNLHPGSFTQEQTCKAFGCKRYPRAIAWGFLAGAIFTNVLWLVLR
jgi:hypothetical protein